MENLFGTIGTHEPTYLLKTLGGEDIDAKVTVSVEPGNGKIPAGAVLYRKSGVLYAPAGTSNISAANNLVVLRDDVDTTTNAGIAVAAAAYRKGVFIAGKVTYLDSGEYVAVTDAHAIVLRGQNIELSPMDDWSASSATEADNRVALAITVTAGTGGTATADKQTAKKGETVTLTITPSSGKELDEIEVTAGDVTLVEGENNYTFVMGDKAVTITVSFKAAA